MAALDIFNILDRTPKLSNGPSSGKIDSFKANISFESVKFAYPFRTNSRILNGIDLHIKEGENIAFVGSSGSGKSTCIKLMQRFYDPDSGEIVNYD